MGRVTDDASVNVTATNLREVLQSVGRGEGARKTWFTRLVTAYLSYRDGRKTAASTGAGTESERALAVIRAACIKSAVGGAASGMILTGATLVTADAPAGALIAVPAAALSIGGEMVARALIHLDMTCDLAEIFGLRFDPENPRDFWQIYGLAFRAHEHQDDDDPGQDLVHRVSEAEAHEIGEKIGHHLLGESVLKNIVPFLGIVTSSATNWKATKQLGDAVRRYLRYRRAIDDAVARAEDLCKDHFDLLIEGLWFVFISDGRLSSEEATLLTSLLDELDPVTRAAVERRIDTDESDWLVRLGTLPDALREPFYYALEVAAAVDKTVSLPEEKILARAAVTLERQVDMRRVERMIKTFEEVGVLTSRP
jgi:hypothetical protein